VVIYDFDSIVTILEVSRSRRMLKVRTKHEIVEEG
jgi:hypothetical protein